MKILELRLLLLLVWATAVSGLQNLQSPLFHQRASKSTPSHAAVSSVGLKLAADTVENDVEVTEPNAIAQAVDMAMEQRYACTRFQRFDGQLKSTSTPSASNQTVVQLALRALDVSRRAPSGFNAQPYKMIVVTSLETKIAVARHCSGKNAHRVRDSDCTIVFLADRQVSQTFGKYQASLEATNPDWKNRAFAMMKLKAILALFSSGYPLPRILGAPIAFGVRLGVSVTNLVIGRWVVVPTLSSAETWASKNTMLVAMAYMIGCSARGLTTCPMEGVNGGGIRRALGVPRRYSIPLIVSTGHAYKRASADNATKEEEKQDDVGMGHGKPGTKMATSRYAKDEMIFCDGFGIPAS